MQTALIRHLLPPDASNEDIHRLESYVNRLLFMYVGVWLSWCDGMLSRPKDEEKVDAWMESYEVQSLLSRMRSATVCVILVRMC